MEPDRGVVEVSVKDVTIITEVETEHLLGAMAAALNVSPGTSSEITHLPAERQLATMINVAFAASLEQEEGRPARFVLLYLHPGAWGAQTKFAKPLQFGVGALRKVFPVARYSETEIVVEPAGDDLNVVGFSYGQRIAADSIVIRVWKPGGVAVGFAERLYLVVDRGSIVTNRQRTWDLGSIWSAEPRFDGPTSRMGIQAAVILRAFRTRSSSGCVAFVPEGGAQATLLSDVMYPLSPDAVLMHAWKQYEDNTRGDNNARVAGQLALRVGAERVVDYAAVDGAVVINHNLEVVGFGAKFKTGNPPAMITEMDWKTGDVRTIEFRAIGGMRHQSAAEFAFRCAGSRVIVSSEDGYLTVFFRDRDQLCAMRSLELQFG